MPPPFPYNRQQNPLVLPVGYLRTEIQVLSLAGVRDGAGGVSQDWTQARKVMAAMAAVEMLAETEIYQTGQFADNVTHRLVLRYPGELGITQGMRVVCSADGQVFVVQSTVNVRKMNRVLWIFCIELNGTE